MIKKILFLLIFPSLCWADAAIVGTVYMQPVAGGASCTDTAMDDVSGTLVSSFALTSGTPISATIDNQTGDTYSLDKIRVYLGENATPAGTVTAYIYDADNGGSEGAPDDRIATADATFDVSVLSGNCSSPVAADFEFASPPTIPNNNAYQVVLYYSGSGTVVSCGDTFINAGAGHYTRSAGVPGASNDSSNWSEGDSNGSSGYITYECQ